MNVEVPNPYVILTFEPRPASLKVIPRPPSENTPPTVAVPMKWGLSANAGPGVVARTNTNRVAIAAIRRIVVSSSFGLSFYSLAPLRIERAGQEPLPEI